MSQKRSSPFELAKVYKNYASKKSKYSQVPHVLTQPNPPPYGGAYHGLNTCGRPCIKVILCSCSCQKF